MINKYKSKISKFLSSAHGERVSIFINKIEDLDKVASILKEACGDRRSNFRLTSFDVELPDYFDSLNINIDSGVDYLTKDDCYYIDELLFRRIGRSWYLYDGFPGEYFNKETRSLLGRCAGYNYFNQNFVLLIKYIGIIYRIFIDYNPTKIIIFEDQPCLIDIVKLFNHRYNFKVLKVNIQPNVVTKKCKKLISIIRAISVDLTILIVDFFVLNYIYLAKAFNNRIIIDYRLYKKFSQTDLKEQLLICPFEKGIKLRLQMLKEGLFYLPMRTPSCFEFLIQGINFFRVRRDWNTVKKSKEIKNIFLYKDIVFWDVIEKKVSQLFLVCFPRIMSNINIFKRFAQKNKVKLLVMRNDLKELERTLSEVSRQLHIPSLVVQLGVIGNKNLSDTLVADMTAAWGRATVDWFKQFGYSEDRFTVTGNPAYDELYSRVSSFRQDKGKKEIYQKLGLDSKKRIITFLTSSNYLNGSAFVIVNEMRLILRAILQTLKSLPEVQLIVKLHPYDPRLDIYNQITKDYNFNDRVVVVKNFNTADALEISDLVIMRCSSAGLEALILDKPLISIMLFKGVVINVPYAEDGAAIGVKNIEELDTAIKDGLYNESIKEKLRLKRKEFVFNYAYKIDGQATKRVEELIYKLTNKN